MDGPHRSNVIGHKEGNNLIIQSVPDQFHPGEISVNNVADHPRTERRLAIPKRNGRPPQPYDYTPNQLNSLTTDEPSRELDLSVGTRDLNLFKAYADNSITSPPDNEFFCSSCHFHGQNGFSELRYRFDANRYGEASRQIGVLRDKQAAAGLTGQVIGQDVIVTGSAAFGGYYALPVASAALASGGTAGAQAGSPGGPVFAFVGAMIGAAVGIAFSVSAYHSAQRDYEKELAVYRSLFDRPYSSSNPGGYVNWTDSESTWASAIGETF